MAQKRKSIRDKLAKVDFTGGTCVVYGNGRDHELYRGNIIYSSNNGTLAIVTEGRHSIGPRHLDRFVSVGRLSDSEVYFLTEQQGDYRYAVAPQGVEIPESKR